MRVVAGLVALSWLMVSACASSSRVFPSKVMEGVDSNFDFANWHRMAEGSDSRKVQLGGRVVEAQSSRDGVAIVVSQLPIVQHPAYGPKDNRIDNGELVIVFHGTIDGADLQAGNRVMVVGVTRPRENVTVNDRSRNLPIVAAECLHFWNTQGREIADFPFSGGAGYVTLRQETVCAKN